MGLPLQRIEWLANDQARESRGDDPQIPEPDADGDEPEGCGVDFRALFISGGDASELADPVEEALDEIARHLEVLDEANEKAWTVDFTRRSDLGVALGEGALNRLECFFVEDMRDGDVEEFGYRAGQSGVGRQDSGVFR